MFRIKFKHHYLTMCNFETIFLDKFVTEHVTDMKRQCECSVLVSWAPIVVAVDGSLKHDGKALV